MSNMSVNVAGVEWKNPVTVASGTFGSGAEYSEFVDLNRLGAVTTKGVANKSSRGVRRHAQCSRTSKSRHRAFLQEGYSFFKAV